MSTIINGTSSAITFPDATIQNTAALVAGGTIATGTVTTLTTTTISDGTNSTSSTNCIQGSAKASALAKLAALGLTQDEVKALLG